MHTCLPPANGQIRSILTFCLRDPKEEHDNDVEQDGKEYVP